jgi:hypothetical protein
MNKSFGCQPKVLDHDFQIINNENPSVEQPKMTLFMHFLAMSRNDQVTTDNCNTQALFQRLNTLNHIDNEKLAII